MMPGHWTDSPATDEGWEPEIRPTSASSIRWALRVAAVACWYVAAVVCWCFTALAVCWCVAMLVVAWRVLVWVLP